MNTNESDSHSTCIEMSGKGGHVLRRCSGGVEQDEGDVPIRYTLKFFENFSSY
jgi:hypothetical protein